MYERMNKTEVKEVGVREVESFERIGWISGVASSASSLTTQTCWYQVKEDASGAGMSAELSVQAC